MGVFFCCGGGCRFPSGVFKQIKAVVAAFIGSFSLFGTSVVSQFGIFCLFGAWSFPISGLIRWKSARSFANSEIFGI